MGELATAYGGRNPIIETPTVPCIDQESMEVVSFSSSFYLDQRIVLSFMALPITTIFP